MDIDSWLSIIAIGVSSIALALSILVTTKSWHKSRAIYKLEELVLRKIDGSRDDKTTGIEDINKKLQTGKYVIQGIQDRMDGDWAVILARIKK